MKKRVFAMFTALSMTMTMLPAPALAGDLPNGLEQTSMISQELQQLEGVRIGIVVVGKLGASQNHRAFFEMQFRIVANVQRPAKIRA